MWLICFITLYNICLFVKPSLSNFINISVAIYSAEGRKAQPHEAY